MLRGPVGHSSQSFVSMQYTLAAKQKRADEINNLVASPLGTKLEAKPGL